MNTRFAAALAAAVLAASACGKKSETVTMNAGGSKIAVTAAASGMALPADFPKDVPLMKDTVVNAVMGSAQQGNLMVFAHTAAPLAEALAFYQENLKAQGWTAGSVTNSGDGAIQTLKKDGRALMLTLAKDGKETSVQIVLPNKKG